MSEYQYVYFQAIDQPLNDEQLEFMQRQSTRAEISRWEFTNEYHFGDFRGDAAEMLRRGYDVHLHYANFGIRRLMFRLPAGLPWEMKTFNVYCPEYGLAWIPDKQGPGGIVQLEPEADAGSYADGVWNFDDLSNDLGRIRESLVKGDLRPLYVAWLACCGDEDAMEPPIPAGLGELPTELAAMAEFYEVGDCLLAAAEHSPSMSQPNDADDSIQSWIAKRTENELQELVQRMLTLDAAGVRAETLAAVRRDMGTEPWSVAEPARTFGQLLESTKLQESQRRERAAAERQLLRENRLAEIAADPDKTLAEVKQLVKLRSTSNYEQAARQLADLREALGGAQGAERASAAAQRLVKDNPKLYRLKSTLRKHGLIAK